MSGYRQHGFDPNAFEQPGPPLRPFDKWQWLGVALGSAAVLLFAADLAGRAGIIPHKTGDMGGVIMLLLMPALLLVNHRRGPATLVGSEQLGRRKVLLVLIAAAAIAGTAAVILSQGAN